VGLVIGLILLALLFGVLGFVITALKWLLIVALVLLVVGAAAGFARGRSRA
jgi:hypothetical protein